MEVVPTRRTRPGRSLALIALALCALVWAVAACSSSSRSASASQPAATPATGPQAAGGAAAPRTCDQVAAAYKAYQKQEQQVKGDPSLSGKDRDSRLLDLHGKWAQLIVDHPTCFSGPQVADAQSYLDLLRTPPPSSPPPAQPTPSPCATASASASASARPSASPSGSTGCGSNPAANL